MANERPVLSSMLMDRDSPIGNSQDIVGRRALRTISFGHGSYNVIAIAVQKLLGSASYDNMTVVQTSNREEISFYLSTTFIKKIVISYTNENSYSIYSTTTTDSFLLMESGDFLLLENDGKIILEAA
jgi:hypothetical protein